MERDFFSASFAIVSDFTLHRRFFAHIATVPLVQGEEKLIIKKILPQGENPRFTFPYTLANSSTKIYAFDDDGADAELWKSFLRASPNALKFGEF